VVGEECGHSLLGCTVCTAGVLLVLGLGGLSWEAHCQALLGGASSPPVYYYGGRISTGGG
jgi:hypothetical protein